MRRIYKILTISFGALAAVLGILGFFLSLLYNPEFYQKTVDLPTVPDNYCSNDCGTYISIAFPNTEEFSNGTCNNGGCGLMEKLDIPVVQTIGPNFCADGCENLRYFESSTVQAISSDFCNSGCNNIGEIKLQGSDRYNGYYGIEIGNNFCEGGCNGATVISLRYVRKVGYNFCRSGCNSTTILDLSGVNEVYGGFFLNGGWSLQTIVVDQNTNMNILMGVPLSVNVVCADDHSYHECGLLENVKLHCYLYLGPNEI